MNAKGLKEIFYEGVNKDDKDFSALVCKLRAAKPDLIYWGGLHDTGGLILRQMRDEGLQAPFMGADGIASDEFAVIAGPGAVGSLMTYGPDPRKRPGRKAVVEKFRAKKFEPEAYTLYSYAAVQIIKQAAEAVKSLDTKKVAAEIASGKTFKTVLGDLTYDKKGDVTRLDYVVYTWRKGPDGKILVFRELGVPGRGLKPRRCERWPPATSFVFGSSVDRWLLPPCPWQRSLPAEVEREIARPVVAGGVDSGADVPEVDRLLAQGVGAGLPALDPGAARQSHLPPPLGVDPHRRGDGLRPVPAFGGDVAELRLSRPAPRSGLGRRDEANGSRHGEGRQQGKRGAHQPFSFRVADRMISIGR